jgi:hypothetical protein
VERWRGSCKPCGLTKRVCFAPSDFAFSFINAANASTEPAVCSASAIAASLAERSISAYSRSRTFTVSPTRRCIELAFAFTARWDAFTPASNSHRSSTTMAVIILVRLAGGSGWCAFLANSTCPCFGVHQYCRTRLHLRRARPAQCKRD